MPDEEYDELAECPTCGADIAIDALICPNCGEEFEEEEEDLEEEMAEEETTEESAEEAPEEEVLEEDAEEGLGEEEALVVEGEEDELLLEEEEEEEEELAECPTCGADIALDATACPSCGQEFEEEEEEDLEEEMAEETITEDVLEEDMEEIVVEDVPMEEPVAVAAANIEEEYEDPLDEVLVDEEKPARMFWVGVILVLMGFFGGPILSYLHDALRIPIGNFKAYENFGWVNWLATLIGSIILGIGVVLLVIGWLRINKWRDQMEALLEEPEPTAEAID